jgi:hypothetical protein
MSEEKPPIPAAILPLIDNPPLLKGESKQHYYELLAALVQDIAPQDIPEWLWVIEFCDCVWEIRRNRKFRSAVIDYHIDSCGYRGESAAGLSFVRAAPKIEPIDKIIDRSQRNADTILLQLEGRRDVFVHRARQAATALLTATDEALPRVVGATVVPGLTEAAPDPQGPSADVKVSSGDGETGGHSSKRASRKASKKRPAAQR